MKNSLNNGVSSQLFELSEETKKMLSSYKLSVKLLKEIKKYLTLYEKITYEYFLKIYEKNKVIIEQVLSSIGPKQIFNFLDEDGDGYLNEDEQILIFSIIKSKLCHLDQELICEGLYHESVEIKAQVEKISNLIYEFQVYLREKLYMEQLKKFESIKGTEIVFIFPQKYFKTLNYI